MLRAHYRDADPVRIASSLRADLIFGRDKGDAEAQTGLGLLYNNGARESSSAWMRERIGIRNAAEAVKWYRRAADQGNGVSGLAEADKHVVASAIEFRIRQGRLCHYGHARGGGGRSGRFLPVNAPRPEGSDASSGRVAFFG
jgi:TPR repeat protein